jgi:lipid II:glycine glycyltransferase (peptidoglycan interpeptide bridge formation enzyme)
VKECRFLPQSLDKQAGKVLLQSRFWARLKSCHGWEPYSFSTGSSTGDDDLLVLTRRLLPGISIAYIPHAELPGLFARPGEDSGSLLSAISAQLKSLLPSGTILLRWDLSWTSDQVLVRNPGTLEADPFGLSPFFVKAPVDIQPPSTVLIDIGRDEESLLGDMKPKTRYNIRLAAKKGIEVSAEGPEALSLWYRLYRETAERDKIAIHPESYYRTIFQLADEYPEDGVMLDLYMARHEGEALAGIIVARYGDTAFYLYGASSDRKRNLMPAYALQWQAMRQAAQAGCSSYDLFGIPPADDRSHPMHGLYRFKTGFGGAVLHRPGCWDHDYRGIRAAVYRKMEKIRRWYYLEYRKRER